MGPSQGDAGMQVVAFLETAQQNFAKLLAEVNEDEDVAQRVYDKMVVENKVAKAAKFANAKTKTSEILSLNGAISDWGEDSKSVGMELDAVMAYADKLKSMCVTKVPSYEERVKAREAEIDGLKSALLILDGKGIA